MQGLRFRRQEFIIVGVMLGLTCSSVDHITVDETSQAVIPARTLVDELVDDLSFLGFQDFDIEQSDEFRNGDYTKDQIDSVRLIGLTLEIVSPEDGSFDFLESVSFYAEAEGLTRVRIAQIASIPEGVTVLELEIDDVELLEFVISTTVTITTEAKGVRPEEQTTINASVVLDVDISVSGGLGC